MSPLRPLLCLALLSGAACQAPKPAVLFGPSSEVRAEDYKDVLQVWSREDRIYQGLNNRMVVNATFHAPEFRRAFAVAFPDVYGHGGQVTRRELVELTGDVEQSHTFFVSLYTPEVAWNDLHKQDSIWRLNLMSSNEVAVAPSEIVRVKVDENLRAVYPYIGRFDECYLVRFPLTDIEKRHVISEGTTSFTLRIASALGVAELTWALAPATAAGAAH